MSNVASISIDKSYLLITPDSSLKINMAFSITSIPGSTFTILEDPTVSANGTSMTIINQNRNSTVTPTLSVFVDPTTSSGTSIYSEQIGSSTIGGSSAPERSELEFILKRNTKYLIKITPLATSAISLCINWSETL